MSSSSDDYIKATVRRLIESDAGRRNTKLTKANEYAIVKNVLRKHKPYCLDVMKKNEYYTNKLYKLLNACVRDAEKREPYDTAETPGMAQSNSKESPFTIESKYIANRYHAEEYIKSEIIKDEIIMKKIKQLISDQYQFQETSWKQRGEIGSEYRERMNNIESHTSLKKLSDINKSINSHKLESIKKEMGKRLLDHDIQVLQEQKKGAAKTEEALKDLGVPFFSLDESLFYPDVEQDKRYVLDLIRDLSASL